MYDADSVYFVWQAVQRRFLNAMPGTRFSPAHSVRISRCFQHLSIGVRMRPFSPKLGQPSGQFLQSPNLWARVVGQGCCQSTPRRFQEILAITTGWTCNGLVSPPVSSQGSRSETASSLSPCQCPVRPNVHVKLRGSELGRSRPLSTISRGAMTTSSCTFRPPAGVAPAAARRVPGKTSKRKSKRQRPV